MACNCDTYQCLDIDYNSCSNGIALPLNADATGNWSTKIEFNGAWLRVAMAVEAGEPIVIPNIFNEQYVHLIKIYDSTGALFNDMCYKLATKTYTSATVTPSVGSDVKETYRLDFSVTNDTVQTFLQLVGAEILEIEIEGLDIGAYAVLDNSTGDITWNYSVGEGQTGFILYKK